MHLDELREALHAAGLERISEEIVRLVLPAIRITPTAAEESQIPIGASKFGGHPDLPPEIAWPMRDGNPLGFLAQFDLTEVAPYDADGVLPSHGMLSFFYDFVAAPWGLYTEDRGGWQVLYFDGSKSTLTRAEWPAALAPLHQLPSHRPQFSVTLSLTQEPEWGTGLRLSEDDYKRFNNVVYSLSGQDEDEGEEADEEDMDVDEGEDANEDAGRDAFSEDDEEHDDFGNLNHQLLGYPEIVHVGGMPLECETVTAGRPNPLLGDLRRKPYAQWDEQSKADLERAYARWRLLFQLGNISGRPVPFGGEDEDHWIWQISELCDLWARGGLMYFWIEKDRLSAGDFSNVWMVGQSEL